MIKCNALNTSSPVPEHWSETPVDYARRGAEKSKLYPKSSPEQKRRFDERARRDAQAARELMALQKDT